MSRVYQPFILEQVDEIIQILEESGFFSEHELLDKTFTKNYLSDNLTDKFILGQISSETKELFTENEFTQILQEIIAGTVLYELKEKGYVNSYEDENTEEIFFLTPEGREYLKNMADDKSV